MEGLRPSDPDLATEYHPMRSCDSDDSQSSGSRSEDNDALPSIIYTSDDSADIGQSDSTYIDSDIANYIAENVGQKMEDDLSRQLLLESELVSNDPPSPQADTPFISHPLSPVILTMTSVKDMGSHSQNLNPKYGDMSKVHLQVNPGENLGLTRRKSSSSSSTEMEYSPETIFLARYEPLPLYPEDEIYTGSLNFNGMKEDPIKSRVLHDQLNVLPTVKEGKQAMKEPGDRFYVGDVPIDARYRDAFFVKWNWPRIRQTCVFVNLAMLLAFLCIVVGLIIQMPQGSDCNPVQEWWQGSTSYYIFVPSFQDTNGDGYGDLNGIITRLDYLQGLRVKTIRLTPVFHSESFIDDGVSPTNYTEVAPRLGDLRDLHLLAALLHERDMFLILDLPLMRTEGKEALKMTSPAVDLEEDVPSVLAYWMDYGVDGFAFTDLHKMEDASRLVPAVHSWRRVMDAKARGLERRVMMVPVELLKKLELTSAVELENILNVADLIDVSLDLSQSAEDVASVIKDASRWDDHPSLPWVNWRIGGPFEPRVNDVAGGRTSPGNVPALGFSLLQLFLPGSVTLYYGDEIGLTLGDENKLDLSWAAPMSWSPKNGGFSKGEPWLALGEDWRTRNVETLNHSITTLTTMIESSQKEVPLYINGIFENVGSFQPKKTTNYKIRYALGDLLIMDRFYPRRNKFAIVVNLGPDTMQRDLSKLYYGGNVLASSYEKEGYIRFQNITLRSREALAIILDK